MKKNKFLKSMILKKKLILKSTILKKKNFLKSKILNEKVFIKSVILNKKFFVLSDFESKLFRRVRFQTNFSTTRQILNSIPKSTTCTFHIACLHKTLYSYRLQYLHQLYNSTRLRSYNTFCTLFRKDFHFWILCVVPLYSQYGLDICRNSLLPVKLMLSILQLLLPHTCLTSF